MKSKQLPVYRIIDVNTNRAVEGLRVMEEVARFVLENEKKTLELKEIRGRLRRTINKLVESGPVENLEHRRALKDVGKELYTAGEAKRESILDVFSANAKRTQEAMRVLEEFTKLIKPKTGKLIKDMRFRVYDLEKGIFCTLSRRLKLDFDLYVITDDRRDHLEIVRQAVAGGARIVQLRDKSSPKAALLREAKQIGKVAKKAGVVYIINDYLDVAREVDADGVHLGQEDLKKTPLIRARKYLGEDKIIGVSVNSYAQALEAEKMGADYVAVGPIFATPIKAEAKPVGLKLLKRIVQHVKIPVVAIGGINESNLKKVIESGCQKAAVIRAILEKENMAKAVRDFRKKLKG